MDYIVFDLEFNQAWDFEENQSPINSKCPFEIVQIGALKLDENFRKAAVFDRMVKPELYTRLHPFVEQITGITIEKLSTAKPFKEVYKEFIRFVSSDSILCVWGAADMKELMRNIRYHKLDKALVPKNYINIQKYASRYHRCPKGTNIGLRNAAELLNIPLGSSFHDAFNAACYTAEIFNHIYSSKMKPALYIEDKEIRTKRTAN